MLLWGSLFHSVKYSYGAYGVETAASTYFDKTAEDLTVAEAALIAGLAQAPEGYNPYNYPEKDED